MDFSALELSRLQFGLTAMFHFIFVPLTIGLAFIIAIMETLHLKTGNPVWRWAARFWGKFFFLNWLFGISTGIPLRFQLAENWAAYSGYVDEVISRTFYFEGLLAPFLFGAAFLFALSWRRLSPGAHCVVTWILTAFLSIQSISILAVNAWMGAPAGVEFTPGGAVVNDLWAIYTNPITLDKFAHTMSAAAVTGAMFVLSISAWYLLKRRHLDVARKSFWLAAIVGLLNAQVVMLMGHMSAYNLARHQPMKFAAMEAMWHQDPVPAPLTAFGFPNMQTRSTDYALEVPYMLTLLAAPGFDRSFPGIHELVADTEQRIRDDIRAGQFDLGPVLLLKPYTDDPAAADASQIQRAAWDTVPDVPYVFWAFRFMVGLGIAMVLLFAAAHWLSRKGKTPQPGRFLWLALCSLPMPWLAMDAGWLVAEVGRQPWTVTGVLPTMHSLGDVAAETVFMTLRGFIVVYLVMIVLNILISTRYIRRGPLADGEAASETGARPVLAARESG